MELYILYNSPDYVSGHGLCLKKRYLLLYCLSDFSECFTTLISNKFSLNKLQTKQLLLIAFSKQDQKLWKDCHHRVGEWEKKGKNYLCIGTQHFSVFPASSPSKIKSRSESPQTSHEMSMAEEKIAQSPLIHKQRKCRIMYGNSILFFLVHTHEQCYC